MKAAFLPISLLLLVSLPSAALAAPTAEFSNGKLTVTGDAADETFTVLQDGIWVVVKGPFGLPDPDGDPDDATCTAYDFTFRVRCLDSAAGTVVVNGGAGVDSLSDERAASFDTDTLNGDDGDDTLTGPVGGIPLSMNMSGGAGDDTLIRNRHGISLITQGGPGDDTIVAGTAGSLGETDHGEAGDDSYVGSPTAVDNVMPDIELVFGDAAADRITGGPAPLEIYGGAGDDRLTGSAGDDGLDGEAGNDVLLGGGGDDALDDGDVTPEVEDPQPPPAGNRAVKTRAFRVVARRR